jgi:hypothetical protein
MINRSTAGRSGDFIPSRSPREVPKIGTRGAKSLIGSAKASSVRNLSIGALAARHYQTGDVLKVSGCPHFHGMHTDVSEHSFVRREIALNCKYADLHQSSWNLRTADSTSTNPFLR